jgi:MFS family permease
MILSSAKQIQNETKSKVPFVLSQISSIFSVMSGSMVFMAFPWLAIQLTGSATSAGILVTITAIPGLLLAPVIGSIIDKFGRKVTILWIEVLTALVSVMIPFVSGLWVMTLPILILIGVVRSTVSSGSNTARKSYVPDVARVAGYSLERANSIQEAIFASGFALGPAIAALCIGWIGAYNTFYVVAACSVVAGILMIPVKAFEHKEDHEDDKSLFKFAIEGFTVLFKTPSVLILMLGVMTLAMIYLPTEMVVLPKYYSLIEEPQHLGTVVGSLMFERLSKKFKYSSILELHFLALLAQWCQCRSCWTTAGCSSLVLCLVWLGAQCHH